jgi:predicted TIM-barrel fold metal-dependent hydrolase
MPEPERIDVQHHFLPEAYVRAVGPEAIADSIVSGCCPEWSPEISLAAMERNGIARAILSLGAPALETDDAMRAADLARVCNEVAATIRRDHPARFGFFATLPMPHVAESLAEISYALDVLEADGVCLLTNHAGLYLGEAALNPVLEELDRRAAVVFVHPADLHVRRPLDFLPAATLEYPFDTTRVIASLLYSGTMARLRRIRFIFSHAGGTVPFLADRIGRLERRPDLAAKVPDGAVAELRRHYYDVALSAGPRTLRPLLDLVPQDRILFASDFPFAGEDTMAGTVKALNGQDLPVETVAAIEHENARALFGASEVEAMSPRRKGMTG